MTAKWDAKAAAEGSGTEPPAWVEKVFEDRSIEETLEIDRFTACGIVRGDGLALVTVRVRNADDLDPLSFQRQTVIAYRAVALALREQRARYPVRFWNFIPDINKPINESLTRYMVFNAGRFSAFYDWYGDASAIGRYVATASGVGHSGKDLVIHCLSATSPGVAIENPRQISSYRYSSHYGPLPPTFARATSVTGKAFGESLLLIGGTASIRGECSLHAGDLNQQLNETLDNLAAVVRAGLAANDKSAANQHESDAQSLRRYRWLRVYYVRHGDREAIAAALKHHCPNAEQVEWRHAHLCRPELLVEIEGVAQQPQALPAPHVVVSTNRQRVVLEA
jgi:chorismate lyase/3-hydroxybenzoate synthase